ncbi:MAG: hypothetical protein D6681_18955 [Calditrichaeota bacterium]|nr:MAG: hypothetical protein D6681_18955 [Calditrichota bacterium]
MKRREFIKYGAGGAAGLALISAVGLWPRKARAATVDINLSIVGADVEMVDGTPVYMWCFSGPNGPSVPGPVIEVVEGDIIRCHITNSSHEEHSFAIHGTPGGPISLANPIVPGVTSVLEFSAPSAGTYMYLDPLNAPVNRVLGLHGALVVLPADPNQITPYSNPTPAVQQLFADLGDASKGFPGRSWDEKRVYPNGRTWVWVMNEIDPRFNELAEQGVPIDPADFVASFLPRYFTLNGESGWFIAHNLNTSPRAKEGEPALIRSMMMGLGTRPPHIHGNHVYVLTETTPDGEVQVRENVIELDTWTLKPMHCIDVLLPFRRPPDVPLGLWPPKEEAFPLTYPIHPHDEVSVTAAGGMYPQGIMNDWHITEPTTVDPGATPGFRTEPHIVSFDQFGCKPLRISPDTPDKTTPDVFIRREFFGNRDITMPDGRKVRFWGFEDPDDPSTRGSIPAPLIRVREGQIVHGELKVRKNTHTIHWHGIEPTSMNDGVPHNSFEVNSRYTYQWQANQAGTYFYHCHKNTVLHFQMGMNGLLVVDPPDGPGRLCTGGPAYDAEMLLAFFDVDPTWRDLPGGHDAGMCGEDVGLNNFNPAYFMINGIPHPDCLTHPKCVVTAGPTDRVLIRMLSASYCIQFIYFPFDVEVVEYDGRPLFPSPSNHGYSHSFMVPAGTPVEMETAQRRSVYAQNLPQGEHVITCEFRHVIRPNEVLGVAQTKLIIQPGGGGGVGNDVITVTRAEFRPRKSEWRVRGNCTVPGPGNDVTVHVGPTLGGPVIGTVGVDGSGEWRLEKRNSSVPPDPTQTISVESSQGGVQLAIPIRIA